MTMNSAIIDELFTSQKLHDTNYDISHRKIQYLMNEKDLPEHLLVVKSPSSDKDKDAKLIDIMNVQYQESLMAY